MRRVVHRRLERSVAIAEEDGDGVGTGAGGSGADYHHIFLAVVIEVRHQQTIRIRDDWIIGVRLHAAVGIGDHYQQAIDGRSPAMAARNDSQPYRRSVTEEIGEEQGLGRRSRSIR